MEVFLLLAQDGLTNGAAYALLALALVLVFVVSRVILVPAGEFISYAALSLSLIEEGRIPGLVWIMVGVSTLVGLGDLLQCRDRRSVFKIATYWIGIPAAIMLATLLLVPRHPPLLVQILLALAIVTPIGPTMYRLAFRRIARASTLLLLIVALAAQFVLGGIGLIVFGPEGGRTIPFSDGVLDLGSLSVPAQSLWIYGVSIILAVALYLFFQYSMHGLTLRAAAHNPRGALLMGISPESAGQLSFALAAFLCAVTGVLISPILTIYYDTGFNIGLKAFVGAVVGGFVSYPLAATGAVAIGVFEAFAAFASSAYKEVIVFLPMVPILLIRSFMSRGGVDQEEEFNGESAPTMRAPSHRLAAIIARIPLLWCTAFALLLAVALPYLLDQSEIMVANYILLYTIVVLGVVLLTGIAGQVSFGQAAFVGVGAYCAAIAAGSCAHWQALLTIVGLESSVSSCGLPPWVSLLLALVVTAIVAVLLGAITLRMRSHYLPIATISWAISIFYFFGSTDILGGFSGLTDLRPLSFNVPPGLSYEGRLYYLVLIATVICAIGITNLLDSRIGRGIRALHSRNVLAESVGVDTARLKIKVFVLAALMACLSGWFYAQLQRFVSPSPFSLTSGAEYLFMAVVGGAGQIPGALFGAALVKILREVLQNFFAWTSLGRFGDFEQLFFGIAIVSVIHFTRGGIARLITGLRPRRQMSPDAQATPWSRMPRPAAGTVLLDIRGISKHFGGLAALKDVSFQVRAGEIVALIGPNGAGKTTLFNAVTGIDPPSVGSIFIRERDVLRLAPHAIATLGVMRTFQHVKLLPDRSVVENVALGAYGRAHTGFISSLLRLDRDEEGRALQEAGLHIKHIGLSDTVDKFAADLPLGQQRLVEVARALAADPALLLLDEPAAGLRHHEKRALGAVLRQLRSEGMGILLVEHDMGFVMGLADRIVVMSFGGKIAEGTARDIQTNPIVREAYLGA